MDLGHLLQEAGCHYRVFDIGRRVEEIPGLDFARFEQGQLCWALPLRQHAWLAVAFWDKHSVEQQHSPFLWFLHLPVDEQGLLISAAREHFVRQVVAVLTEGKLSQVNGEQQQAISQSPFIRKPDLHRMAVLHSLLREPAEPASQVLTQLEHDWQGASLQGLADLVHSATAENLEQLATQLLQLPDDALENLVGLLEFRPLPQPLLGPLQARCAQAQAQGKRPLVLALCRVLLGDEQQNALLEALLATPLGEDREFLATVTARGWPILASHQTLCWRYLEQVEKSTDANVLDTLKKELQSLQPLRAVLTN